jgi:hypothetical protein
MRKVKSIAFFTLSRHLCPENLGVQSGHKHRPMRDLIRCDDYGLGRYARRCAKDKSVYQLPGQASWIGSDAGRFLISRHRINGTRPAARRAMCFDRGGVDGQSQAVLRSGRAPRQIALTGCRHSEMINLRWTEVDIGGSCLHLVYSKEGAPTRARLRYPSQLRRDERYHQNPPLKGVKNLGAD